jgi:hypothetical protein
MGIWRSVRLSLRSLWAADYCAVSFLIFLPSSSPSVLLASLRSTRANTHSPFQLDQIFIRPRINSHPALILCTYVVVTLIIRLYGFVNWNTVSTCM